MRVTQVPLPLTHTPEHGDPLGVTDATGCYHESPAAALGAFLGWCGCGYVERICSDAATLVAAGLDRDAWLPDVIEGDPLYVELLLHTLDAAGLTDHGTSVSGSWLTDMGRQWAIALGAAVAAPRP